MACLSSYLHSRHTIGFDCKNYLIANCTRLVVKRTGSMYCIPVQINFKIIKLAVQNNFYLANCNQYQYPTYVYSMVWCMVWYGVWYGMVLYGMVWYGMVYGNGVWYGIW